MRGCRDPRSNYFLMSHPSPRGPAGCTATPHMRAGRGRARLRACVRACGGELLTLGRLITSARLRVKAGLRFYAQLRWKNFIGSCALFLLVIWKFRVKNEIKSAGMVS